jgi:hypothetical protein
MNDPTRINEIALDLSPQQAAQVGAFAECAGCGSWNRLVARSAPNGGVLWMQPAHAECRSRRVPPIYWKESPLE